MALQNIDANILLDLYNHDTTPTTVKAIQLDSKTRYVAALLQNGGARYDIDSGATVQLIVIRPDGVGVQITGTTFTYGDEGAQFLGPYAELTQVALAVSGKMRGQFKITSEDQILRTEIFAISNGVALDASTDEWAGEYDGYNLDELVQTVNDSNAKVDAMEDDVSELKSGFSELEDYTEKEIVSSAKFEKGSIGASGTDVLSNAAIRSAYIDVANAKYLKITVESGYKYIIFTYTAEQEYTDWSLGNYYKSMSTSFSTVNKTIPLIPKIKYIRVLIATTSDSASITVSDKANVTIYASYPLYQRQLNASNSEKSFYRWLEGGSNNVNRGTWDNGVPAVGLNTNTITNSTTRLWAGCYDIPNMVGTIELSAETGYKVAYYIYDSNFAKVAEKYWSTSYSVPIVNTYKYLVVCISKSDDSAISPSEGSNALIAFVPRNTTSGQIQSVENISNNANINLGWEIASLVSGKGGEAASTTRIRSTYIHVGERTVLSLKTPTSYNHLIYKYDLTGKYLTDISWTPNDITINDDCLIRILMCKIGNGTITAEEVATISSDEQIFRTFPESIVEQVTDIANSDVYPSYYDTQMNTAVSSVRNNLMECGVNGDGFVFISDVHWQSNSKHSPNLIKGLVKSTNIDKIICGGDLIGGGAKANMIALMSDCVDSFKNIARFYALLGNHDTNKIGSSSSDYFSKSDAYALMQKESDFYMNYGQPCYFSFDNQTTKTRYICLDTGEENTTLDSTQSAWLSATLNGMPSGYHALVFAHIIYQATTSWHVGLDPSELAMTSFMEDVCVILDAFNSANNDKKVEAVFGGHVHIDCDFVTDGGIPIVLIDCDARQTFTETSAGSGTANHADKTINEQCFDVVTIDYANSTIKCVRIGRGGNRTITY